MSLLSISVLANGKMETALTGPFQFLYIRVCSNPVQISFDGNQWRDAYLNDSFRPIDPVPTRVFFRAKNALAADISVEYGNVPIAAQSTSQKVASSYAKGTVKANLTTIAGNAVAIPTGDGGHQRKSIVFTLDPNGAGANQFAIITDAAGNRFCTVYQNSAVSFETDAAFKAYATTPGMDLYVGEIYYA